MWDHPKSKHEFTGSPEGGTSRSQMKGEHKSGSWESDGITLTLKPHNSVTGIL